MNPRSMHCRKGSTGSEYTRTISDCPTCALGQNQQRAHPKKTAHEIKGSHRVRLRGPYETHPAPGGAFHSTGYTAIRYDSR